MNIITIDVGQGGCFAAPLLIGYAGEDSVDAVDFDFSAWAQGYGEGTIVLELMRASDTAPYPAILTVDGTVARWTISDVDTARSGPGVAQLIYKPARGTKKSAIYKFYVGRSLTEPGADDPWGPIIERMEEILAEMQQQAAAADQSAESAAGSAATATEQAQAAANSATAAAGSAATATEQAQAAATARTAAEAAQTEAEYSRNDAVTAANAAAGYASQARQAVNQSQSAMNAAQRAADSAANSATAAAGSAATATEQAQAAATARAAAETAQGAAETAQRAAEAAQQAIEDLTVSAEEIDTAGPTVEKQVDPQTGAVNLNFGFAKNQATTETTIGPSPIATFDASAANMPLKGLTVDIEPVQAGEGDPSPENVRPITGWTGCNIVQSPTLNAQDGTIYPITFPTEAGTVYGGTLDVVNNKLRVCPHYASYNGETLVGPWVSSMDVYAPGTTPAIGAQVVDLGGATTSYDLTDIPETTTLLGANNIWADCGDVTVTYGAYLETVKKHSDSEDKTTRDMLAPVEKSSTASANYTIGDMLVFGGKLCKATATIASGDTLAIGTNLASTTVETELKTTESTAKDYTNTMSLFAFQSILPNNEILFDDVGAPSVMVKIPKMTYAQLGLGTSTAVHPAFIVDGVEKSALWISKYQNIVQNSRAYSLPARDPRAQITFDVARAACTAKGAGWHLMTRAEWAMLALWCKKNGTQPRGNNNYGNDHNESVYSAIPTYYDGANIGRVATGTGPLTWSHDGTPSGIWDLNGNVWEWVGGLRLVYGEVQVLANNNAAIVTANQAANSAEWKAIDATTGELITQNGSGTTANSVKLDYVSSHWQWDTAISSKQDKSRNAPFENTTCSANISDAAKLVLQALCLFKYDETSGAYSGDYFYANNGNAERSFCCGGSWRSGANSGVFALYGNYARSYSLAYVGFRSAYYEA